MLYTVLGHVFWGRLFVPFAKFLPCRQVELSLVKTRVHFSSARKCLSALFVLHYKKRRFFFAVSFFSPLLGEREGKGEERSKKRHLWSFALLQMMPPPSTSGKREKTAKKRGTAN